MKKICTATLLAAASLASLGALPAHAAPRVDGWSRAPHIDSVGGTEVVDHLTNIGDWASVVTREARPTFAVSVQSREQADGHLRVFDRTSGDTICETEGSGSFTMECTPERHLDLGTNSLAAVVTSTDEIQTSPASLNLGLQRWFDDPTIAVDALDAEGGTATLSGTSAPGTKVRVWSGDHSVVPTPAPDGRWSAILGGLTAENSGRVTVRSTAGGVGFTASAWLPWATAVPEPVSIQSLDERNGLTYVGIRADAGSDILIRDSSERVVAGARAAGETTTLAIRTPGNRARWTAEQTRGGLTLRKTVFDVNPSGESADMKAPVVGTVTGTPGAHVVSVEGEAGAVVTITNGGGATVALRLIPSGGTVQVPVRAGAGAYVVTQAIDGVTSPEAGLIIPG